MCKASCQRAPPDSNQRAWERGVLGCHGLGGRGGPQRRRESERGARAPPRRPRDSCDRPQPRGAAPRHRPGSTVRRQRSFRLNRPLSSSPGAGQTRLSPTRRGGWQPGALCTLGTVVQERPRPGRNQVTYFPYALHFPGPTARAQPAHHACPARGPGRGSGSRGKVSDAHARWGGGLPRPSPSFSSMLPARLPVRLRSLHHVRAGWTRPSPLTAARAAASASCA